MPRNNLNKNKYRPKIFYLIFLAGWTAGFCGSCGDDKSDAAGLVILNEVACHGRDWVEIVNVSDTEQDLSGWYVADNKNKEGHQYKIPDGNLIQPGEYLVVKRQEGEEDGFSFGIGCGRDTVYLLDDKEAVVDQVDVGEVAYTDTWGHLPDLTGIWRETSSTPGRQNDVSLLVGM
jgi:hypothetical protein